MQRPKRRMRILVVPMGILVAMLLLTSCNKWATPTSDSYLCIYDGSDRGGKKLKDQLPPGSNSKEVDDKDQIITIPASNRFFMASSNDAVRDPLAPKNYEAFARGSVKVFVEGQVRFRFNLEKACEWYSKHGRRNGDKDGDLGFNLRGDDAKNAGWFKFLAENFGITMGQTAKEVVGNYDWAAMVYSYPINADELGLVPKGQQPGENTQLKLGRDLGSRFTELLNSNLGGDYFCGIDEAPNGENACPKMTFQVINVTTADPKLMEDRQKVEATKQQLKTAELEGELQQQQQQATLDNEANKQKILAEQLKTAQIQAEIDTAKCQVYAKAGLDCDGHFPQPNGGISIQPPK